MKLHVDDYGQGPAVLLLHGSPTATTHFAPLVAALVGHFRVLVPELPGYGRSPALPEGAPPGATGELLLGALRTRGISEVSLVGFSLGAYRALELALGGQLEVRHVFTLGGFAGMAEAHRQGLGALAEQVRPLPDLRSPALRQLLAEQMLAPEKARAHPEWVTEVEGWLDAVSPPALADELAQALTRADLLGRLGGLKARLTARVGSLDAATPPAYSQAMVAAAPDAVLQTVEGCGHALLLEDRLETVAAVCDALRR